MELTYQNGKGKIILEDIFYNNFITMAGIMFTAIVGGFFSFVGLVSSKEQKVSEFRQEWINGLRDDLSLFFSSARALCRAMEEARSPNSSDIDIQNFKFEKEKIGEMRIVAAEAFYRVKLRLNKNESEHKELLRLLETAIQTQNQLNKNKNVDYKEAFEAINKASDYSQDILKSEWERVKKGEPPYRHSRSIAMSVLIIGFLIFLFIAYKIFTSNPSSNMGVKKSAKSAHIQEHQDFQKN